MRRRVLLLACLILVGCGGATHAVSQAAPKVTIKPAHPKRGPILFGAGSVTAPQVGDTLLTSNGTWTKPPTNYTYQWRQCDSGGANCTDITAATCTNGGSGCGYTVVSGDIGHTLRIVINATWSGGGGTQTSAPTGVVVAGGGGPACTVFVSTTGGGSGTTAGSPTTFATARSTVNPGDVVCMEAGTYSQGDTTLSRSGTQASPITWTNYQGANVILRYSGSTNTDTVVRTTQCTPWCGTHDLVISGLTFDGADVAGIGVYVAWGSYRIRVTHCYVHNTGSSGVSLNAQDYGIVDHSTFWHIGYGVGWSSAISLWYGGTSPVYGGPTAAYDSYTGFHNIIADNIISGTYDGSVNHSDGNGIIVDGANTIPPALIANNLVYQNGGRGIEDAWNGGDVWIVNNTTAQDGLDTSGSFSEFLNQSLSTSGVPHMYNNIAYGRIGSNGTVSYASANDFQTGSATPTWGGDFYWNGANVGSVTATHSDPAFTALPALPPGSSTTGVNGIYANAIQPGNIGTAFTLAAGSPARNAGVAPTTGMNANEASSAASWLATDLAGNARIQGAAIDAGAYENG